MVAFEGMANFAQEALGSGPSGSKPKPKTGETPKQKSAWAFLV